MQKPLRVVELFAGVGGFRLGLDAAGPDAFEVVWWNQWEPLSKKRQYAHDCYVENFKLKKPVSTLHGTDIHDVPAPWIPAHDLLVGGFPCQDYSVASPLKHSKGLQGRKGALWWQIRRILMRHRPNYVLLENVDRLLTSPKHQRGRDFGVLLKCLDNLGYMVEWRVVNAGEYGHAQKRRRVFIFAAKAHSTISARLRKHASRNDYLTSLGFFQGPFPVSQEVVKPQPSPQAIQLPPTLRNVSDHFSAEFKNAGVMVRGVVRTRRVDAIRPASHKTLGDCLEENVAEEYFIPANLVEKWQTMKYSKEVPKVSKSGHAYVYKEGKIPFPDERTDQARTLLTGEGAITPSRSNHIVKQGSRYRILTPRECENLMGFPPDWTRDLPNRWRYFTMGNAVIVPVITEMGKRLHELAEAPRERAKRGLGEGPTLAIADPARPAAQRADGSNPRQGHGSRAPVARRALRQRRPVQETSS